MRILTSYLTIILISDIVVEYRCEKTRKTLLISLTNQLLECSLCVRIMPLPEAMLVLLSVYVYACSLREHQYIWCLMKNLYKLLFENCSYYLQKLLCLWILLINYIQSGFGFLSLFPAA